VQPTIASHAGGMRLVNASHTNDMSKKFDIHVGDKQLDTARHYGGIDSVEKPKQI
jgi:hypothetical protein